MPLIRTLIPIAFTFTSSVACTTIQVAGAFRNPNFKDDKAPAPTVTTEVIPCLSSAAPSGAGSLATSRLKGMMYSHVHKTPVALPAPAWTIVCGQLATSKKFYKDLVFGTDWKTDEELHNLVKEIAEANKAKSVLIPVVRSRTNCTEDQAHVRDSTGATVATIDYGTQTCKEAPYADLGVFLIDPEGGILYKSTTQIIMPISVRDETDVAKLLKDVPATFVDAAVAESPATAFAAPPAAMSPAAPTGPVAAVYAPPAAKANPEQQKQADKQIDTMISELAGVPDDCKRYARLVCKRYQGPPDNRVQVCKAQVDSVRQIARSPQGKAACTNMLNQYSGAGLE
ncbi:MAG TPA: hypothetical protein VKQ32_02945 [Polyangia bacterium]|nr:hypothetical protein [Polyangia bacterium]